MAKKYLLLGYFGFDNSGDDAILKAIVDNIKSSDSTAEITALSNNPEKTRQEYNIESVNRFSLKEVTKAIKDTHVFVFGGGSLLQDITSSRSLYYYLTLLKIAKFYKKPIFVLANGIGPINKMANRIITRRILDQVDYITLRDKSSYNFVRAIGVTNKNIKVTADPVFLLDSSKDEVGDQILEEKGIDKSKKILGISIRAWDKAPDLDREVAKFCDLLVYEDIDILMIPMHYPHDVEYSQRIKDLSKNERIYIIDKKHKVEDIISLLKNCSLVIAMRLHALIYSAKAQVPIIGLIYDPKVNGLIEELSISEYLKVENTTSIALKEKFDMTFDNLAERKEAIILANKRQEDLACETMDLLKEVVRWKR